MPARPLTQERSAALLAATALLLAATASVPLLAADTEAVYALAAAVCAALAIGRVVTRRHRSAAGAARRQTPSQVRRDLVELALHLSPVMLLSFAFPLAVSRVVDAEVAGVPLTTVLLASSLTVPWLSMAVCLPLYRAIGHLMAGGDQEALRRRLLEVWPSTFAQSAPVVVLFAAPVQALLDWPLLTTVAYVVLCLLHGAFAQSLVIANVERNRLLWAAAWVAYALALLAAPAAWFLPPLAGLATQLLPLRSQLSRLRHLARLDHRDVAKDLVRGLLLGSVLWSHVLFLFLDSHGDFAVVTVFTAVLPAVLAYNYYFVRLAPAFDRGVLDLRTAMEAAPHRTLADHSRVLSRVVEGSVARTAFVGAALAFAITAVAAATASMSVQLVAAVAVAAWAFLTVTVLCYKLDYVGRIVEAQALSAAHLVVCAGVFLALPPGAGAYVALALLDLLVVAAALQRCLTHWRSAEYTLFWRHATAW